MIKEHRSTQYFKREKFRWIQLNSICSFNDRRRQARKESHRVRLAWETATARYKKKFVFDKRLFLLRDAHASFRASVLLLITAGSQSEMRTLTFCCKIYVGGILVFLSQDVKEIVKKQQQNFELVTPWNKMNTTPHIYSLSSSPQCSQRTYFCSFGYVTSIMPIKKN